MTLVVVAVLAALAGAATVAVVWRASTRHQPASSPTDAVASVGGTPSEVRPALEVVETSRHIERALADLRLGVVIFDADTNEIYRNNFAQQFATGRHGNAIVAAAMERIVEGAFLGLSLEESVDLYGPPAQNLLVQASPTYDDGSLSGSVAVIEDVTETRHLDRVRSDFVANVSHELRTPIGALSVLAETMQSARSDSARARLSDRMVREAHRLSETIDDLLSLSRLESGPVIEPVTMDLTSVVAMAVERTAERASQSGITVEVANYEGGPVMVSGDQAQLVSAVSNLCDNALKYSDEGASVMVAIDVDKSAGSKSAGANSAGAKSDGDDNGRAVLTVTDNGPGIPEKDLGRVFERFYRVDSARSRDTGGTGLGLSIVRNAITNHDGTVEVESQEGEGATFTIRLPLADSVDYSARTTIGRTPNSSEGTIKGTGGEVS